MEARTTMKIDDSKCGALAYRGIALTVLSMAIVHSFALQKIKILQRTQILKLCKNSIVHLRCTALYTNKTLQNIRKSHLFKITGTLTSEDIKLNKNYLWDTLEINWDKIKLAFNSNEIKLPKLVMIKMQDKIRVRRMMSREMQNFHIMVKQGMTWYNLETA